jgi:hypothetical protein
MSARLASAVALTGFAALALATGPRSAGAEPPAVPAAPPPAGLDGGPRPRPPASPLSGRPFGFWGMNGYTSPAGLADVAERFHATIFQAASADPAWAVGTLLPMARAAGMRVTLRMTPDHAAYTTAAGDFELEAWKRRLSVWQGSGVRPFVEDGTLAGHMVLDDIATFPGRDPDAAELDEMARYSKELLPGLVTFVREDASALPVPARGTYRYLDATVNQYLARKGDVSAYAAREAATAAALGLGVIFGLNLCDGGDGSSGQAGWRADGAYHAMSADEIGRYGAALAAVPSGMFLAWEYDAEEVWPDGTIGSDYLDRPDVRAALADLGALLATQPALPLLRPTP